MLFINALIIYIAVVTKVLHYRCDPSFNKKFAKNIQYGILSLSTRTFSYNFQSISCVLTVITADFQGVPGEANEGCREQSERAITARSGSCSSDNVHVCYLKLFFAPRRIAVHLF